MSSKFRTYVTMITQIAHKEFIEVIRDGRFRWTATSILLLLILSLLLGWHHYHEVQKEQLTAQAADEEQWLTQGERNPHIAAHFGKYAFKPHPPLSFFDRGIESYTGIAVWMEAHNQDAFEYRPFEDSTTVSSFGELTTATVLQLLLPLLIILMSFSTFTAERENGTLRLILSLGVQRRSLVLGKFIGLTAALSLLIAPAIVLGLLTLAMVNSSEGLAISTTRYVMIFIAYLLYFGAFLSLSLTISAWARTSRIALVVLLGFWITTGLIVPRLSADISENLYPVPSSFEFWQNVNHDKHNGIDGHNASDNRVEALKKRVLSQYQVSKIEELPINFDGLLLQAGEDYGNQVFDKHYGNLWQTYEYQNHVQKLTAIVAPLLAIRWLSMGLAGTDWQHHKHFANAAENYRRQLNKTLNDDLTYKSRTGEYTYIAGRSLWESISPFTYQTPGLLWALKNHLSSLITLTGWFVLTTTMAIVTTTRIKS
ncbi:MAG: DUF3526 domain-containing protein [Acidobacteriota bacterium]